MHCMSYMDTHTMIVLCLYIRMCYMSKYMCVCSIAMYVYTYICRSTILRNYSAYLCMYTSVHNSVLHNFFCGLRSRGRQTGPLQSYFWRIDRSMMRLRLVAMATAVLYLTNTFTVEMSQFIALIYYASWNARRYYWRIDRWIYVGCHDGAHSLPLSLSVWKVTQDTTISFI